VEEDEQLPPPGHPRTFFCDSNAVLNTSSRNHGIPYLQVDVFYRLYRTTVRQYKTWKAVRYREDLELVEMGMPETLTFTKRRR
jgi:hypothetical protein